MSTVKRGAELQFDDIIRIGDGTVVQVQIACGQPFVEVQGRCHDLSEEGWFEVLREAKPVVSPAPPTKGFLPHPISFRVTDEQFQLAHALRSTFENASWGEAFRWLLAEPDVRNLISNRVRGPQP